VIKSEYNKHYHHHDGTNASPPPSSSSSLPLFSLFPGDLNYRLIGDPHQVIKEIAVAAKRSIKQHGPQPLGVGGGGGGGGDCPSSGVVVEAKCEGNGDDGNSIDSSSHEASWLEVRYRGLEVRRSRRRTGSSSSSSSSSTASGTSSRSKGNGISSLFFAVFMLFSRILTRLISPAPPPPPPPPPLLLLLLPRWDHGPEPPQMHGNPSSPVMKSPKPWW